MNIRTITKDLKVRSVDGKKQIEGYALTFNEPSQPMPFIEYIEPNALNGVDLSKTMLLYGHEFNNILARADSNTLQLAIDDIGLHFIAELADTTLANDVYSDIENGNIKGCSFGFTLPTDGSGEQWQTDNNTGQTIHTIKQIDSLDEVSLTPIPAYTQTSVAVKRSLEEYLRGVEMEKEKETQEEVKEETEKHEERAKKTQAIDPADIMAELNKINARLEERDKERAKKHEEKHEDDKKRACDDDKEDKERACKEDHKRAENKEIQHEEIKKGDEKMRDITPKHEDKKELAKRDMYQYLATAGHINTRDLTSGIGLSDGSVLIPSTILAAENRPHQFTRLGGLVRTVSVKTTTGKLPMFLDDHDVLMKHTEFADTTASNAPKIQAIPWDLETFVGQYVYSQELLTDSTYDWEAELASKLFELRDNTTDQQVMTALTTGKSATSADDLVAAIKTALNVNLMPIDSSTASIVVSQSAFNYLDTLEDKIGRPLIQPDLTKGMGHTLLGHTIVIVADTLFPNAKAGDINVIVAPLQKAVINFKNSEITGKFIENFNAWERILSIFMRLDVVQAMPTLINWYTASKTLQSQASSVAGPKG